METWREPVRNLGGAGSATAGALLSHAQQALELAERLQDGDAESAARQLVSRALHALGRVAFEPRDWSRDGSAANDDVRLRFAQDGSLFEIEGTTVVLTDRPLLRRLFATLLTHRRERPGEPVAVPTLLAAGWPDERMLARAAKSRLHTAVRRLRSLGLGERLVATGGGYLLAGSMEIVESAALSPNGTPLVAMR
jgi:hypothetical protein